LEKFNAYAVGKAVTEIGSPWWTNRY